MQCSKQRTYAMSVGVSTICGRRIVKVEPRPGLLSTVMSPPIMWAAGRRAAEATAESRSCPVTQDIHSSRYGPWRNPITGIAGCCARTAIGHAAAPPRNVMNFRRLMSAPGSGYGNN